MQNISNRSCLTARGRQNIWRQDWPVSPLKLQDCQVSQGFLHKLSQFANIICQIISNCLWNLRATKNIYKHPWTLLIISKPSASWIVSTFWNLGGSSTLLLLKQQFFEARKTWPRIVLVVAIASISRFLAYACPSIQLSILQIMAYIHVLKFRAHIISASAMISSSWVCRLRGSVLGVTNIKKHPTRIAQVL